MSFYETLCDRNTREGICEGIQQSLAAIPVDDDVRAKLQKMLIGGTPVQQIYLIIFAIVRLSGLYEIIAQKSSPHAVQKMNRLYYMLNEHLMGENEEGTDAFVFVRNVLVMADYSQ